MNKKVIAIILCVALCLSSSAIYAASDVKVSDLRFSDVKNTDWFKDYVYSLTSGGTIKGYVDGTFRPDNNITRAEFTAVLIRALGEDPGQPETGEWYSRYRQEAEKKKYIIEGEFDDLDEDITRGEMARMVVRAAQASETYPENIDGYASMIKDYNDIRDELKEFVLKAYATGIITGRPDGKFYYKDTATRAEAAAMIVRLIDSSKRVVPMLVEEGKELEAIEKLLPGAIMPNEKILIYSADGKPDFGHADFFITRSTSLFQVILSLENYESTTYEAVIVALKVYFPQEYESVYNNLLLVSQGSIGSLGVADYSAYYDDRHIEMKKYENGTSILIGKKGVKY